MSVVRVTYSKRSFHFRLNCRLKSPRYHALVLRSSSFGVLSTRGRYIPRGPQLFSSFSTPGWYSLIVSFAAVPASASGTRRMQRLIGTKIRSPRLFVIATSFARAASRSVSSTRALLVTRVPPVARAPGFAAVALYSAVPAPFSRSAYGSAPTAALPVWSVTRRNVCVSTVSAAISPSALTRSTIAGTSFSSIISAVMLSRRPFRLFRISYFSSPAPISGKSFPSSTRSMFTSSLVMPA